MTTLVQFRPSLQANFTFSPQLDGQTYNAVVTWNVYAQRYYLSIYTLQGVLALNIPLIGSPDVQSVAGYTLEGSPLLFLAQVNGNVIPGCLVTGVGIPDGTLVRTSTTPPGTPAIFMQPTVTGTIVGTSGQLLTLSNPSESQQSNVTFNFTYSISLTKGYFDTPIVYRSSSGNFEIG